MGRRSAGAALETSVRVTRGAAAGTDECDGPLSSSIFGRRTKSAGRLLGISVPTGELTEAFEHMNVAIKYKLRAAEAQRKAAAAFEAHVRHQNNAAIADVGQHHADLLKTHADIAERCAHDQGAHIKELRKMNNAEKAVREKEMKLVSLHEKKAKIADSLRKGGGGFIRRRSEGDTLRKRQQLEQINIEIEEAEIKLDYTRREMEIIKMLHYRKGMQGIADSHMAHAAATAAIYGCYREITEMVPAISTQDPMTMNYDGREITQNCVTRLRREIGSSSTVAAAASQLMGEPTRRRTGNYRTSGGGSRGGGGYPAAPALSPPSGHGASTPPPPYTPTAPTMSELPQPGGCSGGASGGGATATVVPDTSSTPTARPSPPRFNQLYPRLPANPYRRNGGLHS